MFGFPRTQATALEPLYLANYLLIPVSVFGAWYVLHERRLRWVVVTLLTILWLTLSRGGFGATAAILIVLGALGTHIWVVIGLLALVTARLRQDDG